MTRYSSFSILFLAIALMVSSDVMAATKSELIAAANHLQLAATTETSSETPAPDASKHKLPATRPEEHEKKTHIQKTEETAHIHHFHKERVKKIKRHHKKFWVISKIILILCHLVLLYCAFLHLTH